MIYCQFEIVGKNKRKCKVCGMEVESSHPPNKIICNCLGPSLSVSILNLNETFKELYNEGIKTLNSDYGHCSKEQYKFRLQLCSECPKRLECKTPIKARKQVVKCPIGKWKSRWIEPHKGEMPLFYNVEGTGLFLKNHFKDSSIFFLGCGPSLLDYDLKSLSQRGLITFGVNGMAAKNYRPNLWTSVDTPLSFHEAIWRDPAIMKFVSGGWSGTQFTNEDRKYSDIVVRQCPNIILYDKNDYFEPEKFFEETTISWGCAKNVKDVLGITGNRSVMLVAFKIMTYLGFKRIYLLGCDFNMEYDSAKIGRGITYAFKQYKNKHACDTNNEQFLNIEKRLESILPGFKTQNIKIYNCSKQSKLTLFPYKSFDDCKKQALKNFPTKITTKGLYQ